MESGLVHPRHVENKAQHNWKMLNMSTAGQTGHLEAKQMRSSYPKSPTALNPAKPHHLAIREL